MPYKKIKLPLDFVDFMLLIFIDQGYGSNEFLAQLTNRSISGISARIDKLEKLELVYRDGESRNTMYRITDESVVIIQNTYRIMNISLIELEVNLHTSLIDEEYAMH